ncbi:MAG: amino acid adenylation domain-containing protein [Chloroflexota bacterium]
MAISHPIDVCIHSLFERQAAKSSENIAVVCGSRSLTYEALNQQANRLAHYLQSKGVESECLVGLYMSRSIDMIVSLLAILKSGGAYLPLSPLYPEKRLAYILADAGINVVLTDELFHDHLTGFSNQTLCIPDIKKHLNKWPDHNLTTSVQSSNLAYVIYTSGSTGRPKGVAVEHRGIGNMVTAQIKQFGVHANSRVLQFSSLTFDASVAEIFKTLLAGGTLIIPPEDTLLTGESLLSFLQRKAITLAVLPPSVLQDLPQAHLPHLETLVVAGEACPIDLPKRWRTGRRFFNAYGPTEATVCTTIAEVTDDSWQPTIGKPIANTQVTILDENLESVPIDTPGELCIGGPGLARGYLHQPQRTAEAFINHTMQDGTNQRLYRTGDLAQYRMDGQLEFLGRIDDQVKIRGYRIELTEIEATLREHSAIQNCVVTVQTVREGDQRLVAYLVSRSERRLTHNQLNSFLRDRLPNYMIPAYFTYLDALPLNVSGKIDRQQLPPLDLMRPELAVGYRTPRNEIEHKLAQIWHDVLGVTQIGIHDDFFDVGGHSLLTMQLASRIRAVFQTDVPLNILFDSPTIAQQATALEKYQPTSSNEATIVPVTDQNAQPLSFAQQRLWFLNQWHPHTSAYNLPIAYQLQGSLDIGILKQSLQDLISRHSILRTVYTSASDIPSQIVKAIDERDFDLITIDLRHMQAAERLKSLADQVQQAALMSFDLSQNWPIRVYLFQLEKNVSVLLLVLHHIAADHWSMRILAQDLAAFYKARVQNTSAALTPLLVQYGDFASWEQSFESEHQNASLAYWQKQLSDLPPQLSLPTDRPRPVTQTLSGAQHRLTLPPETTDNLRALGKEEHLTLFMVLLTGFSLLLKQYSRQDDIVIGTPVASRKQLEMENLIGFFVNTLVLRTDLSGNPVCQTLLQQVRKTTLDALMHQDFPFEKLVEHLQPNRDLSQSPLIQVTFALLDESDQVLSLPNLEVTPFKFSLTGEIAQFDLTLTAIDQTETIELLFTYNTDLFDAETISRLGTHYQNILQEIHHLDRPITKISCLNESEFQQQVIDWNQTAVPLDTRPIHQVIESQAQRIPNYSAVICGTESLNYKTLNDRANQLAHHLRHLGVESNTLVGVCLDRSLDLVVTLLAILKAGGGYVPIDPAYPQERRQFMLTDSNPICFITEANLCQDLELDNIQPIYLDTEQDQLAQEATHNLGLTINPEQTAYAIYTSGSTGKPKAALIPHRALANHMQWLIAEFSVQDTDRLLQKTAFSFDASVWEFYAPLISGGQLILAANEVQQDGHMLAQAIDDHNITMLQLVPTQLRLLLKNHLPGTGRSLRYLFCGGEVLSSALVSQFYKHFPKATLVNLYGPTEGTIDTTFYRCSPNETETLVPIGSPIANVHTYILDAWLKPVPIGVPGDLYVGGIGLMKGYLNRPDLNATAFVDDPFQAEDEANKLYKTGDIARFRANGAIEFLGRADGQLKLRGYRIELGEIENALRNHPDIADALVLTQQEEKTDTTLVAYLICLDNPSPTPGSIRAYLDGILPSYMLPNSYTFLSSFPLLPNGKIDHQQLPNPNTSSIISETDFVAPRTADETVLVQIWLDILGLEKIGIYDNFFILGGHSLLATRIVSAINQQLQISLPIRAIFESPTIASLAEQIATLRWLAESSDSQLNKSASREEFEL